MVRRGRRTLLSWLMFEIQEKIEEEFAGRKNGGGVVCLLSLLVSGIKTHQGSRELSLLESLGLEEMSWLTG